MSESTAPPPPPPVSDDEFMDQIQRAIFQFFWEQASPATGQVKDRALAAGNDTRTISSIAATGFGLTALCIGHKRGYGDTAQIKARVTTTLDFLFNKLTHVHVFGTRVFRKFRRCRPRGGNCRSAPLTRGEEVLSGRRSRARGGFLSRRRSGRSRRRSGPHFRGTARFGKICTYDFHGLDSRKRLHLLPLGYLL